MKEANPLTHPLQGLSLVEASAGTGKTTLLVRLYLRALLVAGLSVEKILAVTYTRAATGELSVRIRDTLLEAERQLTDSNREGFWAELFALAGNEDDVKKRIAAALAAFDETSVFTIHGFCQRTLADHAFEAGAAFASERNEDEDALCQEVAADFWRRRVGAKRSPAYVEWFVETFESPAKLLDDVLKRPLQVSGPLAIAPAVNAAAVSSAESAFAAAAAAAAEEWHSASRRLSKFFRDRPGVSGSKYKDATVERVLSAWQAWLDGPASPTLPMNFKLLGASKLRDALNKGESLPEEPFFAAADNLKRSAEQLLTVWWQEAVRAAFEFVRSESRARKRKLRERGFDDMLSDLHDALRAPEGKTLARRIADRYPLILVDEFQDTDPLQYEIFTAIHAAGKKHGLVFIGDPKQAIYRFRGADVFTYLRARRVCEKRDRLFNLTHNYRSAEPLLAAVNTLFGGVSEPFEYAEIPYLAVTSGRKPPLQPLVLSPGNDAATTILWEDAAAGGKLNKDDAERHAARICAGEIVHLLGLSRAGNAQVDAESLQAKDIAVLVNENRQGLLVQEALRKRGIAAAMVATKSVFASAQAEELESLLGAIAEPADGRLLRRALATSLLGATAAELAQWVQDETGWGEIVGRFRGYYDCWQRDGVAAMLAQVFRDEGVIERTLARPDGERAMTNLRHLAELAGAEAARRPGVAPLLAWFGAARAEDAHQEALQLRLESDENLVRIATLHKAKGLQYPVVFLPFLWDGKKSAQKTNAAILAHDDDYRALLDLGSREAGERVMEAAREMRAEDARKTYVALTRAERACYAIALPANQVESSALGRLLRVNAAEEFHAGLSQWVESAKDAITLRAPVAKKETSAGDGKRPRGEARDFPYPERLRQRFHVASYSLLAADARGGAAEAPDWDEAVQTVPAAQTAAGIHAFPAGAASGTFLHAVIEALDFDADEAVIRDTVQAKLAAYGFESHWEKTLSPWLAALFHTSLGEAGCKLADIPRPRRRDELEFHFLLNRVEARSLNEALSVFAPNLPRPDLRFDGVAGQMKGYLDLVFEHDGRFWIADYKSNRLGSDLAAYTPEALDRAMAEHRYDLQYLIYTVAVHRYLKTRIADYDYERHFGGVLYLFLRGMAPDAPAPRGVWHTRPARADIERLDALLVGSR